jgi:hypothetical protein
MGAITHPRGLVSDNCMVSAVCAWKRVRRAFPHVPAVTVVPTPPRRRCHASRPLPALQGVAPAPCLAQDQRETAPTLVIGRPSPGLIPSRHAAAGLPGPVCRPGGRSLLYRACRGFLPPTGSGPGPILDGRPLRHFRHVPRAKRGRGLGRHPRPGRWHLDDVEAVDSMVELAIEGGVVTVATTLGYRRYHPRHRRYHAWAHPPLRGYTSSDSLDSER